MHVSPGPWGPTTQLTAAPFSDTASVWSLGIPGLMPTTLSHSCQPYTRPAHCRLISSPKLALTRLPMTSTLDRLSCSCK